MISATAALTQMALEREKITGDSNILGRLSRANFVEIDEAADVYYLTHGPFYLRDLPPIRSPFGAAILTWAYYGEWRQGQFFRPPFAFRKAAIVIADEASSEATAKGIAEFLVIALYVQDREGCHMVNYAHLNVEVGPSGELLNVNDICVELARENWVRLGETASTGPSERDIFLETLPVLYSLGVLNCKNVLLADAPGPPRPLRRRLKWHMDFKRLVVTGSSSMQKDEGEESHKQGTGLVARHYCRGHFRDYRAGAGLFGRLHGVYWQPPHMKGSLKRGIVLKTYDVRTSA